MDYYSILGVDRTATEADIRRAYRRKALQWHPDKNAAPEAEAKFRAVSEAYQVLADSSRRHQYDGGDFPHFTQSMGDFSFRDPREVFQDLWSVLEESGFLSGISVASWIDGPEMDLVCRVAPGMDCFDGVPAWITEHMPDVVPPKARAWIREQVTEVTEVIERRTKEAETRVLPLRVPVEDLWTLRPRRIKTPHGTLVQTPLALPGVLLDLPGQTSPLRLRILPHESDHLHVRDHDLVLEVPCSVDAWLSVHLPLPIVLPDGTLHGLPRTDDALHLVYRVPHLGLPTAPSADALRGHLWIRLVPSSDVPLPSTPPSPSPLLSLAHPVLFPWDTMSPSA